MAFFHTQRGKGLRSAAKHRYFRPWLERLEERINPGGFPPAPPAPPCSAFSNLASLPIIGPALTPAFLTSVAAGLGTDALNAIKDGDFTPSNPSANGPTLVKFTRALHSFGASPVPLNLSFGSFLTLQSTANLNLFVDIYYDVAFDVYPDGTVTAVDTSLKQDSFNVVSTDPVYQNDPPAATVPDTTLAIVVSATVPTGFTATGTIAKQLDVTFTDAGKGGAIGLTNLFGVVGMDLGSFSATTPPNPQGLLYGQAKIDGYIGAFLKGYSHDVPFLAGLGVSGGGTELKADWSFNADTVVPAPADPSTLGAFLMSNLTISRSTWVPSSTWPGPLSRTCRTSPTRCPCKPSSVSWTRPFPFSTSACAPRPGSSA